MQQKTLKDNFYIEGIGVHGGQKCSISVKPAPENTGIIFISNESGNKIIPNYKNVGCTAMCTQVANDQGDTIKTIEHLMAAFYGTGITNAIVEVSGGEVPILDGSAVYFVELIEKMGIESQNAPRKVLKVTESVQAIDGDKYIKVEPYSGFAVKASYDFTAKGLKTDTVEFDFAKDNFWKWIASARTFGFEADIDMVRKLNLALGASLENTVVYNDEGVPLNPEGLRMDNESARHKILDFIGDVSLSQYWIQGRFECHCSGHSLNNVFLRLLLSNIEKYEIISE